MQISEPWSVAAPARGRPLWKTVLVGGLLCVIPVVGWSMATVYVLTRHEPDRYKAGEAAGTGFFLVLLWVVVVMLIAVARGIIFSL